MDPIKQYEITKLSVIELKALIYDNATALGVVNKNIEILTLELSKR